MRTSRHLLFWLLWWLFFYGSYFSFQLLGIPSGSLGYFEGYHIAKAWMLVLTHMAATYSIIYILLPHYLTTKRWMFFILGICFISIITFITDYALYSVCFRWMDATLHATPVAKEETIMWSSLNSGLLSGLKVITAATTIKLLKYWWLKQREKDNLEKQKLNAELSLLKSQIQPDFLFDSLQSIRKQAEANSSMAPETLLMLSDFLSYVLYECNQPVVPLSKEIAMMKNYMTLEKQKFGNQLDMEFHSNEELNNFYIAPLLLLPFIENSFRQCYTIKTGQRWINIELTKEDQYLLMKLINGYEQEVNDERIKNVKKALYILYGNRFELKMYLTGEIHVSVLKVPIENSENVSFVKHAMAS